MLINAKVLNALNTRETHSVNLAASRQLNGSPNARSPIKSKVVQMYHSNMSTGSELSVASTLSRNLRINSPVKCCRMSCCSESALSEKAGRIFRRTLL